MQAERLSHLRDANYQVISERFQGASSYFLVLWMCEAKIHVKKFKTI